MNELQHHMQHLRHYLEVIDKQYADVSATVQSVEAIGAEKIYTPVAPGVFFSTKDEGNVLVNVGHDILVKKSTAQAVQYLQEQLIEIEQARVEIQEKLSTIEEEFSNVQISKGQA